MTNDVIDWLMEFGASYFDMVIIFGVVSFAKYTLSRIKNIKEGYRKEVSDLKEYFEKSIEDLKESVDKDIKIKDREISLLFKKTDENKRLYNQVDKSTYGIAIAIQKSTGIELIKQSADGKGDHTLNRDV